MPKKQFMIGRPINGVTINGLEYLLNEDNSDMLFDSKEDAILFLVANDYTDDQIETVFVIEEVKSVTE